MINVDGRKTAVSGWQATVCLSVLLALMFTLLLSCQPVPQSKPPLDEVMLQLKWVHQAQFAGYYLARERGYYRAEGINVTLQEGGQGVDIVQRLAGGQVNFAVLSPETVLVERAKGTPLVAIAAINRRSPVVYISMAASGIRRPADFLGKTVAALDTSGSQQDMQVPFFAMMKKLGLDISAVKIVPWDSTYAGFNRGEVDVTPCYATSNLVRLRLKGEKLNLIWPGDYGVHFYSDLIVTTRKMVEDNPALVTRFLCASLKGWQDALEDYQQAVDVSLKYSSNRDTAFQTAMMEAMLPLINTGEDFTGWMKPADWRAMYDMLREQGLLSKPFDVGDVYTMRFLQEVYGDKKK